MVVSVAEPDAGRAADGDRRDAAAEGRGRPLRSAATPRVIAIRDSFVPLIDVGRRLGYRDDAARSGAGRGPAGRGAKAAAARALLVDAIQGQRQVVIKSLEANYRRCRASPPPPSSATAASRSSSTSTPSSRASRGQSLDPETSLAATG